MEKVKVSNVKLQLVYPLPSGQAEPIAQSEA